MKTLFFLLLFSVAANISFGQLTKGNWLVGGSGSFSSSNQKDTFNGGVSRASFANLTISPNLGYFFTDKWVVGTKLGLIRIKYTITNENPAGGPGSFSSQSNYTWIDIGPFTRYYLLKTDLSYNVFVEADYSYQVEKIDHIRDHKNSYSFFAGPVVYFNSTVGLEFMAGYSLSYGTVSPSYDPAHLHQVKEHALKIGLGLQVHLQRSE